MERVLVVAVIGVLLSGCIYHGGIINDQWNYNIGVRKSEYADGYVKYRRLDAFEAWQCYERFVQDRKVQGVA
jgi:hypothetical protein